MSNQVVIRVFLSILTFRSHRLCGVACVQKYLPCIMKAHSPHTPWHFDSVWQLLLFTNCIEIFKYQQSVLLIGSANELLFQNMDISIEIVVNVQVRMQMQSFYSQIVFLCDVSMNRFAFLEMGSLRSSRIEQLHQKLNSNWTCQF